MRPIRALVVDDSEDMRLLIRFQLESDHSFEVCAEASDGEAAVAIAASCSPDVIILDLMMPKMNGLTALPILRSLCPNAPVVVLTAYSGPEEVAEANRLGAYAVLAKEEVTDRLKQVLHQARAPEVKSTRPGRQHADGTVSGRPEDRGPRAR